MKKTLAALALLIPLAAPVLGDTRESLPALDPVQARTEVQRLQKEVADLQAAGGKLAAEVASLRTEAASFHLLNRGHARETLFHDDQDRSSFLELLARSREHFAARLDHYFLMGNHFHLLLQLPGPQQRPALMAGLSLAYGRQPRHHLFLFPCVGRCCVARSPG